MARTEEKKVDYDSLNEHLILTVGTFLCHRGSKAKLFSGLYFTSTLPSLKGLPQNKEGPNPPSWEFFAQFISAHEC
jgi:hypothetical protein